MQEPSFRVGNTLITKVLDLYLNGFTVDQLLPGSNPDLLIGKAGGFDPKTYDPETRKVSLSVHSWVVRHEGLVILIDTAAGNHKERPQLKVLDHLNGPYLDRLKSLGVEPNQVDYILLTHIHADHVGWNTSKDGGRWTPTFPNATVICSDREWRYSAALDAKDEQAARAIRNEAGLSEPQRLPTPGVFSDSMAPLEAHGRLQRIVVDGAEILPGIRYLPTPGHSIDHASLSLTSQGQEAIFGGDIVHHPFELTDLHQVSMFCEFPDAAIASRRQLISRIATSEALFCSSHFPASSAGKVTKHEGTFRWAFADPEVNQ